VSVQYAILCHVDDNELRVATCVHTLRLRASSGSLNEPGGTHGEDDSNDQASERQPTCADPGRESRAYVYIQSPAITRPGGCDPFHMSDSLSLSLSFSLLPPFSPSLSLSLCWLKLEQTRKIKSSKLIIATFSRKSTLRLSNDEFNWNN